MSPAPLTRPIAELRSLIRAGDLTALDLVDASLRAIAADDDRIGAFTSLRADAARAEASRIRLDDPRPLAGIPIAVKENRAVAGQPLRHGSRAVSPEHAAADDPAVATLRAAGAIVIGMTSMSEFGLLPGCEPVANGPTRNPLDPERSTGGSSGGSAASVAAGFVPLALGNDAGGSLRIPAAWCGLATLVLNDGVASSADGVLARSWSDVALVTDVLGGVATRPAGTDRRIPHFLLLRESPASGGINTDFDQDALETAASILTAAGFRRCERELPTPQAGPRSFFPAVAPRVRRAILATLGVDPDSPDADRRLDTADLEPYTRSFLQHAGRVSEESHRRALASLVEWEHLWRAALGPATVILSPTTSRVPPIIGILTGQHSIEESGQALAEPTAFTWLANALGWAASAVPLPTNSPIPASVQVMGPSGTIESIRRASAVIADENGMQPSAREEDDSHG